MMCFRRIYDVPIWNPEEVGNVDKTLANKKKSHQNLSLLLESCSLWEFMCIFISRERKLEESSVWCQIIYIFIAKQWLDLELQNEKMLKIREI